MRPFGALTSRAIAWSIRSGQLRRGCARRRAFRHECACSVRFGALANIMADLLGQKSIPALQRRLRRDTWPQLLVIDELGYMAADARAAGILFSIISHRNQRASTIITTNLSFSQWDTMFPNATSWVPLADRFGQACHIMDIEGRSWRDREGQAFRNKTSGKSRAPDWHSCAPTAGHIPAQSVCHQQPGRRAAVWSPARGPRPWGDLRDADSASAGKRAAFQAGGFGAGPAFFHEGRDILARLGAS